MKQFPLAEATFVFSPSVNIFLYLTVIQISVTTSHTISPILSKVVYNIAKSEFLECTAVVADEINGNFRKDADEMSILLKNLQNPRVSLKNPLTFDYQNKTTGFTGLTVKKYLCSCELVLFFTENGPRNPRSETFLRSQLHSISRRNYDHYIFLLTDLNTASSVLNSDLAQSLRYKFAVVIRRNKIIFASVCHHCSFKGIRVITTPIGIKKFSKSFMFQDYTRNYEGSTLRISATTGYGAGYAMKTISGKLMDGRGYIAEIHQSIRQRLNMSYELSKCSAPSGAEEGSVSGTQLENGTWIGCVQDILIGKADLSFIVSPNAARYKYVEFGSAMCYTWIGFATKMPSAIVSWSSAFHAFHTSVWIFIGSSLVLATVMICLTDYFSSTLFLQNRNRNSLSGILESMRIMDTALALCRTLLSQGVSHPPKNSPARRIFLGWIFFVLVTTSMYTSNLTAMIAYPGANVVPRTMEELSKSKKYGKGSTTAFLNGLGKFIFLRSKSPTLTNIYHDMESSEDELGCLQRAYNTRFACVHWDLVLRVAIETEFVDQSGSYPFIMSTDVTNILPVGYIARKGELFMPHFNYFVSTAFDTGLLNKMLERDKVVLRKMHLSESKLGKAAGLLKQRGTPTTSRESKPLSNSNLQGCYTEMWVGTGVAFLVFIFEHVKAFDLSKLWRWSHDGSKI
ncbi:unnamed protein product [Orchesella dallaii]|uniref:Ionotropic glutamate receptor C-terminal domain-containing protein n=1 Tax=Orchesella dallaii TaxID=48710 RepID=A0ABP1QNS8_9HEXA